MQGSADTRGSVPTDATRPFIYDAPSSRVVFGPGRLDTLGEELDRLGVHRALLVATGRDRSLVDRVAAALGERYVATYDGVRPHVPVEVAAAARQLATDTQADGVVSIGGGSTTGTAKAVALTHAIPVVAVPTTYAGSEATAVWGLTEEGVKSTGVDRNVLPRTVIYDPQLTLTLPVELSAVSGLNAMAHSVEAFWAPGRNPVSSALAERSIRALAAALPAVLVDPEDLDVRSGALLGAWLAGAAFAVAGSGLHHKVCHVLGGAYDLPHAQTHAIVLPHVLAANAPAAPQAAARIADALGVEDAADGLLALNRRLGVPAGLRSIGLDEDQLADATERVLAKVPADNPRPMGRDEVVALLHAAWRGEVEGDR